MMADCPDAVPLADHALRDRVGVVEITHLRVKDRPVRIIRGFAFTPRTV